MLPDEVLALKFKKKDLAVQRKGGSGKNASWRFFER